VPNSDIGLDYSITSVARNRIAVGTVRPSVFAVLRLTTRENLVGACTGRLAGFSPRRMRSQVTGEGAKSWIFRFSLRGRAREMGLGSISALSLSDARTKAAECPARWRGHLDHLLPAKTKVRRVKHHAALPYAEMPAFMAALRAQDGIAARALEFTALTAARTGDTIGAMWDEVSLSEKAWTVPPERMKAGNEHRVPLSGRALAVLGEAQSGRMPENRYVFSGGKPGKPLFNIAMTQVLRRMGRGDITVHGFRSTFRDWAAERTTAYFASRCNAKAHSRSASRWPCFANSIISLATSCVAGSLRSTNPSLPSADSNAVDIFSMSSGPNE
jgi:integrase